MEQKLTDIFSAKDRWTQGSQARTKDQGPVAYCDPEAYSFCLLGAVNLVTSSPCEGSVARTINTQELGVLVDKIKDAIQKLYPQTVNEKCHSWHQMVNWNDSINTTFEMVQNVIKEVDNT